MIMARRRRRGYGSPPETHLKNAREMVRSARWWLKEARYQARTGNCTGALDSLMTAVGQSSMATSERRGAGSPRVRKALFKVATFDHARRAFEKRCVVPAKRFTR